ncbi:MAG: tail fiber domain-containing protein [Verrucomicrobiota bacterium]
MLALSLLNPSPATLAQGTAFTYQGQLQNNGSPSSGTYSLIFSVFTTNSGGSAVAGPVTNAGVAVVNGLFQVRVDFGNAVWNGATNWLQIGVASNGVPPFTTLAPRQELTPTPYAIYAENAGSVPGFATYPNTNGAPNLLGGSSMNFVSSGIVGATIGGGGANDFLGDAYSNTVTGDFGTIGGGLGNTAGSGYYTTVGGGFGNSASGGNAAIMGGALNRAGGSYSLVGGGFGNSASGGGSFVGGGGFDGNTNYAGNSAQGGASVVGGGFGNLASLQFATVGGGRHHQATGFASTIAGGDGNSALLDDTFIGGGWGNSAQDYDSTVCGGDRNSAGGYATAVLGGEQNAAGGDYSTIGGGNQNNASGAGDTLAGGFNNSSGGGNNSTISGGNNNNSSGSEAVIGGGQNNEVSDFYTAIGGGVNNTATNMSSVVCGGTNNVSGGYAATVTGGSDNQALGDYSLAAGNFADTTNNNSFVWSDGSTNTVSTADYQFMARASGGFVFYSTAGATGVSLAPGSGSWSSMSDRNAKNDFAPVDPLSLLAGVAALPIRQWSYKTEPGVRHLGPMAQDFYATFGVGEDDKHITTVDEEGVALAAIQALNQKLDEEHAKNVELRARLEELEQRVNHQNGGAK